MILVTGGTGLVGAHLLLQLIENGETVRAIYRNPEAIQKTKNHFSLQKREIDFEKINWIQGDILDISSLEIAFNDIDYVYHCAALISFDPKDEAVIRKTNIEGTANIVNFCLAKNVQKLCFTSSIAALGDPKEAEIIIDEKTEWNPEKSHSDYAISKYGAELEIWRGQQEGLKTIIVNPGVIIGPSNWEDGSGAFFKKIKKGFPFYTKGTTGFIAVTDVVNCMIQLMKSDINNERYLLVAETTSFENIFNSIADALMVKKPYIYINPFCMNLLWKIDWFFSTFLGTKRVLDKETANASCLIKEYSNQKIKNCLSIEFTNIHEYIKKNTSL